MVRPSLASNSYPKAFPWRERETALAVNEVLCRTRNSSVYSEKSNG